MVRLSLPAQRQIKTMTATNDFMAPVSFGNCFLLSNTMNYIYPLNVTAFTVHVKVLTHYNEMNEINEVYTTAYMTFQYIQLLNLRKI